MKKFSGREHDSTNSCVAVIVSQIKLTSSSLLLTQCVFQYFVRLKCIFRIRKKGSKMPVAKDSGACGGKISIKTETSGPASPILNPGARKRALSSGTVTSVTNNVTWPPALNDSRIHIASLGRPRSRFSSVRNQKLSTVGI